MAGVRSDDAGTLRCLLNPGTYGTLAEIKLIIQGMTQPVGLVTVTRFILLIYVLGVIFCIYDEIVTIDSYLYTESYWHLLRQVICGIY